VYGRRGRFSAGCQGRKGLLLTHKLQRWISPEATEAQVSQRRRYLLKGRWICTPCKDYKCACHHGFKYRSRDLHGRASCLGGPASPILMFYRSRRPIEVKEMSTKVRLPCVYTINCCQPSAARLGTWSWHPTSASSLVRTYTVLYTSQITHTYGDVQRSQIGVCHLFLPPSLILGMIILAGPFSTRRSRRQEINKEASSL